MKIRNCRKGTTSISVDSGFNGSNRHHTQLVLRGYNPYRYKTGVAYGPYAEFGAGVKRFCTRGTSENDYAYISISPLRLFNNGPMVQYGFGPYVSDTGRIKGGSLVEDALKYVGKYTGQPQVDAATVNWDEVIVRFEGVLHVS